MADKNIEEMTFKEASIELEQRPAILSLRSRSSATAGEWSFCAAFAHA